MNRMPVARALGLAPDQLTALIASFAAREQTVATAESLTAGLLSAVLTEIPGSSAVMRGGLVVYATDLKHTLAGVPATLLDSQGPVAPEVAVALAEGARTRCTATWGVGLTGVAGPAEQDGHPVGTVFVAVVGPERTLATVLGRQPGGRPERDTVRAAAVRAAIHLLETAAGGA